MIILLDGGRFYSKHLGALDYYDSKHKLIKVSLEGGFTGELVEVLQEDGSYEPQLLSLYGPDRRCLEIIEYEKRKQGD